MRIIKKWILKWIYKNVDIGNFQEFKNQNAMIALLDHRVNHLEENKMGN